MVGIISYKLNTPLKNIEIFQSKISKKISKRTAYQFIKERYDIGTLYRGSSIINSMLFFSLYFGVYHTLNSSYGDVPYRYLFNPLLASLAACLPINIINIVKNTYHGR